MNPHRYCVASLIVCLSVVFMSSCDSFSKAGMSLTDAHNTSSPTLLQLDKKGEDMPLPPPPIVTPSPTSFVLPLPPSGDWTITAETAKEIQQAYELKPSRIGTILDIAWSPDGNLLAVSGSSGVVILDGDTLEILMDLESYSSYSSLSFSADGHRLAASSALTYIAQIWETGSGETVNVIEAAGPVSAISPNGNLLAAAEETPTFDDTTSSPGPVRTDFRIFNVDSGNLVASSSASIPYSIWNDTIPETIGMYFSADGGSVQTVNILGDVRLWNVKNGQMIGSSLNVYTRERLSSGMCQVDGSSGSQFSVGCYISYLDPPCTEDTPGCNPVPKGRFEIGLWETSRVNRSRNLVIKDPDGFPLGPALHPERKEVSMLLAGRFEMWGFASPQEPLQLFDEPDAAPWVNYKESCPDCIAPKMTYKPTGARSVLAVAFGDEIVLWDVAAKETITSHSYPLKMVTAAALTVLDGKNALGVGYSNGSISTFIPPENTPHGELNGAHPLGVQNLALLPDDNLIISTGLDGTIKWWQVGRPEPIYTGSHDQAAIFLVSPSAHVLVSNAITRDNQQYIIDEKTLIQDTQTQKTRLTLDQAGGATGLSQDGKWLAVYDYSVFNLWDLESKALIRSFSLPPSSPIITDAALNSDGSLLAVGEFESFYVLNTNSKKIEAQGIVAGFVRKIAFHPNGCLLAVSNSNGDIHLFDISSNREISRWHAHAARVNILQFSQDGRLLLSQGEDGVSRLWGQSGVLEISAGKPLPISCRLSSAPVTSTPVTPTATSTPVSPTATATQVTLYRTLSLADPYMTGNDVLQLQQRLIGLGYEQIGIPDGLFGPKTEQAVKLFQEKNSLVVDGLVGPITWERLFDSNAIPLVNQ